MRTVFMEANAIMARITAKVNKVESKSQLIQSKAHYIHMVRSKAYEKLRRFFFIKN